MTTTIDSTAFNRGTDPILQFITVDQAREIVDFRGDADLRQRIDQLAERAEKAKRGHSTYHVKHNVPFCDFYPFVISSPGKSV